MGKIYIENKNDPFKNDTYPEYIKALSLKISMIAAQIQYFFLFRKIS